MSSNSHNVTLKVNNLDLIASMKMQINANLCGEQVSSAIGLVITNRSSTRK